MVAGNNNPLPKKKKRLSQAATGGACALLCIVLLLAAALTGMPGFPGGTAGSGASPSPAAEAPAGSDADAAGSAGSPASGTPLAGNPHHASAETDAPSKPARTPLGIEVPEELVPELDTEYVPDVVLVSLADGYSASELTRAINESGCTVEKDITDDDIAAGMVELEVRDGYDVAHAMTQLELLPELEAAQPDFIYHLTDDGAATDAVDAADAVEGNAGEQAATGSLASLPDGAALLAGTDKPNDPRISDQWMLEAIHAYGAWSSATTDKQVSVAIIDSGCLVGHEDLAGNIVATYNAVNGSADVTPANGHGTHVAGIVAAQVNNGKGVAGASHDAGIIPIQVFENSTAKTSVLVNACEYIIKNASRYNIRVANFSLGRDSYEPLISKDDALLKKIDEMRARGVLSVAACGNTTTGTDKYGNTIQYTPPFYEWPSDYENVVGVIALDSNLNKSSFSNYNTPGETGKDISAPGRSILSTYNSSTKSYASMSGTSMAAPIVAGVAALVFAANPHLTPAQVTEILYATAGDLGATGWDEWYGAGIVDAEAAVQRALDVKLNGTASLLVGGTSQLTPSLNGNWTWSSSDESIATVSGGLVEGKKAGRATIFAKSNGTTISKTVTVYELDVPGSHALPVGLPRGLAFSAAPSTSGYWTCQSSDSGIASVSPALVNGEIRVTGVKPGKATITVSLASNPAIRVAQEVLVERVDLSKAKVTWPTQTSFTYTGSAITFAPKRVDYTFSTGESLEIGAMFTTAYRNNVNVGTASATLTAPAGACTGTASKNYVITPAGIASASTGIPAQTYTGAALAPKPTASFNGTTLKAGTDYTISYANNVKAGTATATLRGTGNFTGTKAISFKINAASLAGASIAAANQTYSGKALTPAPTVKRGGRTLAKGSDYTVSYRNNVNAGTATITVTGKGNYTGTKSGTFKISPLSLARAAIAGVPSWTYYTGSAIKPLVTVKLGNATLTRNANYTVAYAKNKNAGTARVTITGKGNYSGSVARTFRIIKRPSYAGATRMPVSSKATWTLSNCSAKVTAGAGVVSISGKTVTAKKAGSATIGIYNAAGAKVASRTVRVFKLSGTTHLIKSAANTSLVFDVKAGRKTNRTDIQLYRVTNTTAQRFKFALLGDGTYRILNVRSNKAVSVAGGSKANGANVWQYAWKNIPSQRWRITVDAKNRLTFINKKSGKALYAKKGKVAARSSIVQQAPSTSAAQKWTLS